MNPVDIENLYDNLAIIQKAIGNVKRLVRVEPKDFAVINRMKTQFAAIDTIATAEIEQLERLLREAEDEIHIQKK